MSLSDPQHPAPRPTTPSSHRKPGARALRKPRRFAALRTSLMLSAAAVTVTGVAVGGGVVAIGGGSSAPTGFSMMSAATAGQDLTAMGIDPASRTAAVSRSADRRTSVDPAKLALLTTAGSARVSALTRTESLSDDDPRDIGRALLAEFGFSSDQFGCLDSLWTRESNWNPYADNPSSSAYGIPQSLPGSKMATVGADWATNPVTQIRWGLGYIADRYGSPCGAWAHSEAYGNY